MDHKDIVAFGCGGCDLGFYRVKDLTQHIKEHSKDDSIKYYECVMCGKAFSRAKNLSKHAKLHYELPSTKKYTCKVCGSEYTQSGSLNRHKPIHLEHNTCSECGKGFRLYEYLLNYKRMFHPSKDMNSEQIDVKSELSKHEEVPSSNTVNLDEEI